MTLSHEKAGIKAVACSLVLFFWLIWGKTHATAQPPSAAPAQDLPADQARMPKPSAVPPGTILPVVLRTTISAGNAKPGQILRGQIAQEVPLPDGSRIRKGSLIEGEIVEVTAAAGSNALKISIRFNKLHWNGQVAPITTDLRAMAGFMEVLAAGTPTQSVGESDVFNWMTTRQIGGDSVYGRNGIVTSKHNAGQVVGKSLQSGGVLVQVNADPAGRCRGVIEGNENPQALWVFSSDACGTYGLTKIHILHAGRTEPVGTFTLGVADHKTKIHSGDGLLLRVIG